MMNESDSASPSAQDDGPVRTPGSILRASREAAGLSHAEVSQALHLTIHYIKALENDEYGKLPGLTFVKGYLRSYARYVKADVDEVLGLFERYSGGHLDSGNPSRQIQRSRRRHDQALRWALVASVLLVAGVGAAWWFIGKDQAADGPVARLASRAGQVASPVVPAGNRNGLAPSTNPGATLAGTAGVATATADSNRVEQTTSAVAAAIGDETGMSVDSATSLPAGSTLAMGSLQAAGGDATGDGRAITDGTDMTAGAEEAGSNDGMGGMPESGVRSAAGNPSETTATSGGRQVRLMGNGDDVLQLHFTGSSWVEIDDGTQVRLYSDLLRTGDDLTVQGAGPFHVLLGDARNVAITLNAETVDFARDIRADSTARLVLDSDRPAPGGTD